MRKVLLLVTVVVLAVAMAGCGGGGETTVLVSGPGFVGIDDSVAGTAPLLTVTFQDPVLGPQTVEILSNPLSDGDIAFDPPGNLFTVTTDVTPLFFGVDSLDPNLSEFRAFLTFPLGAVPAGVPIINATVELFITEVSFAGVVPAFLDLVPYGILGSEDFNAAFLAFGALDFIASDGGNFVLIPVTSLMQTAQAQSLPDFQVRFSLESVAPAAGTRVARPQSDPVKLERTASPVSQAVKRPERLPRAVGPAVGPGADRPARTR